MTQAPTIPLKTVALLIDGENLSADHAGFFISRAVGYGELVYKRIYGNVVRCPKWDSALGFRFIHTGSGKNSADMMLTIQAVELALTHRPDTIVIATSDSDFSHLVHYLREHGVNVVGIGEAKATENYRKTCSKFIEIPEKAKDTPPRKPCQSKPQAKATKATNSINDQILTLLAESPEKRLKLSILGQKMASKYDVKISTLPDKNWHTYCNNRPELWICDVKGPMAHVRIKAFQ